MKKHPDHPENPKELSIPSVESNAQIALSGFLNDNIYEKVVTEMRDYAILLLDTEGQILNWNPGAESIKGYHASEIIGNNFRVFYTEEDRNGKLPESLLATARVEGRATHEGWRVKKDGSTFWGSIVITALHDSAHNVIGFSKVTRDLTERKMAEEFQKRYTSELERQYELLRLSEERYHRMTSEVEDYAIILLDTQGNIINWNKGAENIKGYTESEIAGKNFRTFYLPQDQESRLPEYLLEQARTNNRAAHEGWRVRKDGSRFWGSVVITALHDDSGMITGFSKVTRDLTEKKHFEDYILMQNKQLEEYAYIVSHDLQEPLRKIVLFSGMVKSKIEDKEAVAQYLDKIELSTKRMSNLIGAVLDYSRMDDATMVRSTVDLQQILTEVESDFDLLLADKKGKMRYEALPSVVALPIQMRQLFSNLVSNAIKFSEAAPEITITAELVLDPAKSSNMVKVLVKDNGIGFDPEFADKIFKMFHRLHDNKSGTGIGLALCKKIVENHGGTISATSKPGKGTTIELLLPLAV